MLRWIVVSPSLGGQILEELSHLDGIVSESTYYFSIIILQTVDAFTCLTSTYNLF